MLDKHGEFFPFAAAISPDGQVRPLDVYAGSEHPPSQEVIQHLLVVLKQGAQKGEFRATGICSDVRVMPPGSDEETDAIHASLEHKDGEAVSVFLPYKKKLLRGFQYGELFAAPSEPNVFAPAAPSPSEEA